MIYFYISIGILIVLCLWNLIPVLLNLKSTRVSNIEQTNIEIAKQRVSLLKEQHGDVLEQSELEATLLDDLNGPDYEINQNRSRNLKTLVAILVATPLIAGILYSNLGNTQWAFNASLPTAAEYAEDPAAATKVLVEQLDQRLAESPNNAEGWAIRAQVAMSMNDFEMAESAYANVNNLVGDDPNILTAWADASLLVNGNQYTAEIANRIERALTLDPKQQSALWIGGLGYLQLEQYDKAEQYLAQLLPLVADNAEASVQVQARLDQVKNLLNIHGGSNADSTQRSSHPENSRTISVVVALSPDLTDQVNPDDLVFVFARAQQGPPFPVAAVRLTVKDLPIEVILDGTSAMMPEHTLDSVDQVDVLARIAKSGSPTAVAGDLTSNPVTNIAGNQTQIQLMIDQVVK